MEIGILHIHGKHDVTFPDETRAEATVSILNLVIFTYLLTGDKFYYRSLPIKWLPQQKQPVINCRLHVRQDLLGCLLQHLVLFDLKWLSFYRPKAVSWEVSQFLSHGRGMVKWNVVAVVEHTISPWLHSGIPKFHPVLS